MKEKEDKDVFDNLEKIYEFTEKEFKACPWIKKLKVEEIIEEIEEELEELKEEIKKGKKEDMAKEAADVFRDALLLLFKTSEITGIDKSKILNYMVKKLKWRKPWVEEGKEIEIGEAIRIWKERKSKEDIKI